MNMKKIVLVIVTIFEVFILQAQVLYGTTSHGGDNLEYGTITKFTPVNNSLVVAKSFGSFASNPLYTNFIEATNGKLYGMTSKGGSSGAGIIFSYNRTTSSYTKVKDFDNSNGASPAGSLIQANNGKLYGMTSKGGSKGYGVIFSFAPSTSIYTKLKDFDNTNGSAPYGSLLQAADGNLYGMTAKGGSKGYGVIFSFAPSTSTYTKLKDFDNTNGSAPYGSLLQASDGNLYGMTSQGGNSNAGVIFSFDLKTYIYTKMKDFDGTNGASPFGSLIQAANGKLYGMTSSGGITSGGVIFSFDLTFSIYTKLKDFNGTNGGGSFGDLIEASDGKLYGLTSSGGSSGDGFIFSFNPLSLIYTKLKDFENANGAVPLGSSMQASDGKLYGMTSKGGRNGAGVIFSFDPSSFSYTITNLAFVDGSYPNGSLLKASDGKLYGTTNNGGNNFRGVIFSLDPSDGTFVKLWDFDDANGTNPGSLIQAKDGKLYGMTSFGGNSNKGVIFSFDPISSTYTNLKNFDNIDGGTPFGNLMQAKDGKLYGMTTGGGSSGNGVIFSFNLASSAYLKLKDFNFTDGASPYGSLIQARDGKLYGMTHGGSQDGGGVGGVIFSFDPSTFTYLKLKDFDYLTGANPFGSLMQASDGKLYGATDIGGLKEFGVIFSFDISTSTYTNLKDFDNIDGSRPRSTLMQASDGKIYGTTWSGGTSDVGVIFSFEPLTSAFTKLKDYNGANGANPDIGSVFVELKDCITKTSWYQDADADGYGNPTISMQACTQPAGYVSNKTDCDDKNKYIHGPTSYYRDFDGDGFGNVNCSVLACIQPLGYVTDKTDCDDYNKSIQAPIKYYRDADGDGYGDANTPIYVCKTITPVGYVKNNYDCDDRKKAACPDYESVRMCHKGVAECIYAKNITAKLILGWTLGPCSPNIGFVATRIVVDEKEINVTRIFNQKLPQQYKLSNYPNPFSGVSTILYELPVDSKVSITVYDLKGSALVTLVNENKKAGSYNLNFNAGIISRGSLYYRITAVSKDGRFEQTNKMIQVK